MGKRGKNSTADEAKRLLEDKLKLKLILERESVSLVLSPITPLEDHKCTLSRPASRGLTKMPKLD